MFLKSRTKHPEPHWRWRVSVLQTWMTRDFIRLWHCRHVKCAPHSRKIHTHYLKRVIWRDLVPPPWQAKYAWSWWRRYQGLWFGRLVRFVEPLFWGGTMAEPNPVHRDNRTVTIIVNDWIVVADNSPRSSILLTFVAGWWFHEYPSWKQLWWLGSRWVFHNSHDSELLHVVAFSV